MRPQALSRSLRRQQLDRALAALGDGLRRLYQPRRGWIRETREAIGMSAEQLARRLRVRQPTVSNMEKAEAAGTVSLASLRRTADAMGCTLVYAFVPKEGSLETLVRAQAERVATRVVERVEHTMALEAQAPGDTQKQQQIAEIADDLFRTLSRDLWDDSEGDGFGTPRG